VAFVVKRTRPSEIKRLLAEQDIHPSRVLGQNFLVDENILRIVLDSAHLAATDRVLEIGPGLGVLTEALLTRAHIVIAVEKDPRLAAYVRETFGQHPALRLMEADALDLPLSDLLRDEQITHVVSNLPYAAGTRILMELIASPFRPLRMIVMLQLDVAERLVAQPGAKAYGIAGIHAQMYYDVVVRKTVSPTCFYPPPDVRSAIVEFYGRGEPQTRLADAGHFGALVKWCFSQRRKQIGGLLQKAPASLFPAAVRPVEALSDTGIAPSQRPEDIAVTQWGALSNRLVRESGEGG